MTRTDRVVYSQYTLVDIDFIHVLEVGGKLFNAAGLDKHVEFPKNDALELLDQVGPAQDLPYLEIFFYLVGQIIHQPDILADLPVDTRPDDLDGQFFPGRQSGPMDLGHRGGGDRFGVEFLKNFGKRPLQFFFDDLFNLRKRDRRDAVLKFFEFVDVFRREQVGPGAHELSQLDEAGTQFFQGQTKAFR